MKVKTYSKQTPRAIALPPIWSRDDAREKAKRIALALEGYGYERKMPQTRDGGWTWKLNSQVGFAYAGGRHRDPESISLKACARLLAKGQNTLEHEDNKLRAELNKHPTLATEAVLSGAAKSGDMISVLKAITQQKQKEISNLFAGADAPKDCSIQIRTWGQHGATLYMDFYNDKRLSVPSDAQGMIGFLQHFEDLKEQFVSVAAHIAGWKISWKDPTGVTERR